MKGRLGEAGPGVRIKICGITRPVDAERAAHLGADAIGLVFYQASPRAVEIRQACEIASALPPEVTRVGLFVNPPPDVVDQVLSAVPLDLLQFHGAERPEECRRYPLPYMKAARLSPDLEICTLITTFPDAFGLLLDGYQPGFWGGTGRVADWSRIPHLDDMKMILAGGLRPDNVAQAIHRTAPYAVDTSSGVEETPGVKSLEKMSAFIEEVRNAECRVCG